ncbi:MAG TPA: NADH-quinone oxidoreductase subunit NuoK [Acidimicrobiia bacterium]|jgi:NADH:ubiquinone oxidoreductase subunit K
MLVNQFLVVAALLFSMGTYGLLVRRNTVMILLSVELMLNAVNINFIAFEAYLRTSEAIGQVFSIFVITIAAAEVGIGLAIVLMIFRNRQSANVDEYNLMKF